MNIAFDAHPLISDRKTGIGFCEAGLVGEITKEYKENTYYFEYFSFRNPEIKEQRLALYMRDNCRLNMCKFSGFVYKSIMNFVPLPYSWFFGKKSDLTHFFNYHIPPFVNGKRIVTVHDMVYKAFPETMNFKTKLLLDLGMKKSMKRADVVVTDSEFSKREIIKYFPEYESKIEVVECGVDRDFFHKIDDEILIKSTAEKHCIEGEYFLYLGTLEPRKNLERLISAYKIFNDRNENVPKLVLAGGKGWLYETIFEQVQKLGLKDKVIFTQYIPSEDICPLMSGAKAFVFPSIYEGFGMPPLEAMACGTPVITSDIASLPEVVGDCAVLIDPYSESSIADGLEKLFKDEDLRKELSEKGLERAKCFTWNIASKKLYRIYERVMKG